MAFAIVNIEGDELIAVLPDGIDPASVQVTDWYAVNQIVGVNITPEGVIDVRDENGHVFLSIMTQDHDNAVNWAIRRLGWTCVFDG